MDSLEKQQGQVLNLPVKYTEGSCSMFVPCSKLANCRKKERKNGSRQQCDLYVKTWKEKYVCPSLPKTNSESK